MANLITVTSILTTWAFLMASGAAQSPPSQPPSGSFNPAPTAVDCSTLIYDMIDCMEFLTNGGTEKTPNGSCCLGFETVIEVNADCICYALSAGVSLGLDINMTRAEALPSDCRVSAPPISNCHESALPGGSPVYPPESSAPSSNYPTLAPTELTPAAAAAPTTSREAPAAAPYSIARSPASHVAAPSPARSGASTISVAFSAFLVIVASIRLLNVDYEF